MRGNDFNWRDHAKRSWAGSPEYEVLPDEPDLPVLDPADARKIYEAATQARVGRQKRRRILDHSAPLFDRTSRLRGVIRVVLVVAFTIATAWVAVWWFRPDQDRANRRLVESLATYEAARAVFVSTSDCDQLVRAYRRADDSFVRAASTSVRLGANVEPDLRDTYLTLLDRVDAMNRHFDASGCPRP